MPVRALYEFKLDVRINYMGMSQNRGAHIGARNLLLVICKKRISGTPILRHSHMFSFIPSCALETRFQYLLPQLSAYPLGFGLKYLKTWDYLIQTPEQSHTMLQHAAREAGWVEHVFSYIYLYIDKYIYIFIDIDISEHCQC